MILNIQKIIAIQNYGTSGTTLTHSLLDNHPKIISMPYLHALPLYSIWDQHLKNLPPITAYDIVRVIKDNIPYIFDVDNGGDESLKQMGPNRDKILEIDEQTFLSKVKILLGNNENISRRDFIILIFIAYNQCFCKEFSDDSYICYPIHSSPKQYAKQLTEDFKEVKFLHMVREPVQNIGSLTKHIILSRIKPSLFKSCLSCAYLQITKDEMHHWSRKHSPLHARKPYLKDSEYVQTKYIKLEDLHHNPDRELNKLMNWLALDFDKCLRETTFMGLLWHNRAESQRVSGFNKTIVQQKHNRYFNKFDHYRLKLLTKMESEYFGYASFSLLDKFMVLFILPFLLLIPFKCDFNLDRLKLRLKALTLSSNIFLTCIWIVFDRAINMKEGAILLNDTKISIKHMPLLIMTLPAFIFKSVCNYIGIRFSMIKLSFNSVLRSPQKNGLLIQPLDFFRNR